MAVRPTRDERSRTVRPRAVHLAPALVGVLLAIRASELIRDNSFLWHVEAGRLQLAGQQVLRVDPFSFTMNGMPWRTQSWLLELAYGGLADRFAGLAWANWLVLVSLALTFAMIGIAIYVRTPSPFVVAIALIVGVLLVAPFAQPRPVVVSYALIAAVSVILTRPKELAWTLVPLLWVFASVHGSWVIVVGLVLLEAIRTRNLLLARALGVGVLATLFTAHGIGAWRVLVDFASSQAALDLIQEWLPPDFTDVPQAPYLLVILGVLIALGKSRVTPRDLVVVAPFLLYGLTSQRAVFPATIVLLPYAAQALPAVAIPRGSMSPRVVWTALVLVVAMAFAPMMARPLGINTDRFPDDGVVQAVRGTRAYQDTAVGGYLIYVASPDHLVFIDDRAELYGVEIFEDYLAAAAGDYREVFARYGIESAIVTVESALHRRLLDDGWSEAERAGTFAAVIPGR